MESHFFIDSSAFFALSFAFRTNSQLEAVFSTFFTLFLNNSFEVLLESLYQFLGMEFNKDRTDFLNI
jgi:hypothetical protein